MIHKPNKNLPVIAAFDFDKTLTDRDSFPYFLLYCFGFLKTGIFFLLELPAFFRYLFRNRDRQRLKERLITRFFKGMSKEKIQDLGVSFAQNTLSKYLNSIGMDRLVWHQKQGHTCVLVSASLEIYLLPWGKSKGFDKVLGSCLAFDEKGCVEGKLEGLNCRGKEKVVRLRAAFGPLENFILYAYGDSKGDQELLEAANFPYYRSFS